MIILKDSEADPVMRDQEALTPGGLLPRASMVSNTLEFVVIMVQFWYIFSRKT